MSKQSSDSDLTRGLLSLKNDRTALVGAWLD